jgi:hypothetical protein
MYDPFHYLPAGYGYADHQAVVDTLLQCWLGKTDTRMVAVPAGDENYALMRTLNPSWVVALATLDETHWLVFGVSVPPVAPAACEEASRAASP